MQAKIHKAKLLTIQNSVSDPEKVQLGSDEQLSTIHTYLAILKHIIKRNKASLPKLSDSSPKVINRKDQRVKKQRYEGQQLERFVASQTEQWKSIKLADLAQNQLQTENKGKLREIQMGTRTEVKCDSSHIVGSRLPNLDEECRKFTPIGKIYNQLKLRTEASSQAKVNLITNSCLKLQIDNTESSRKFSIFRKPAKSKYRNNVRSDYRSSNNLHQRELSSKQFLEIYRSKGVDKSLIVPILPTPW